MFDRDALTKVRSMVIAAVIILAVFVGGSLSYIYFGGLEQTGKTIKIGVCADLDSSAGKSILQEALLAVEQVNAEGGVLGRLFEVVAEDDDSESLGMDVSVAANALTRLVTVEKADFIITSGIGGSSFIYQEKMFEYEKIVFDAYSFLDEHTQKVLDDYDRYKYYFRVGMLNGSAIRKLGTESLVGCRNYTGFNKVALLSHTMGVATDALTSFATALSEQGFDVAYTALIPYDAVDFTSYFAQAEAAGAEILYPYIVGPAGLPFVQEYYNRQCPMVMWGMLPIASQDNFWELTNGKCEHISFYTSPTATGYPFTSKTLAFREAYIEKWNGISSGAVFDVVRFILPDAIRRAGTIETDAVIQALEKTEIETSLAKKFAFTSSHDILASSTDADYWQQFVSQWQNGDLVPVYPEKTMEEAGATYTYPPWPGPWD